ncbi:repC-binding protein A [Tylopilus felleus]
MPQQGSAFGGGFPAAGTSGSGNITAPTNNAQTAQIRELVTQNPELRQLFIQQIAQKNPQLGQLLTQNPDLLLQFLESMGDTGGAIPGAQAVLNATDADRAAIERLEALGFPKQAVIEAYFACDKNEQLAANYLVENA